MNVRKDIDFWSLTFTDVVFNETDGSKGCKIIYKIQKIELLYGEHTNCIKMHSYLCRHIKMIKIGKHLIT